MFKISSLLKKNKNVLLENSSVSTNAKNHFLKYSNITNNSNGNLGKNGLRIVTYKEAFKSIVVDNIHNSNERSVSSIFRVKDDRDIFKKSIMDIEIAAKCGCLIGKQDKELKDLAFN